MQITSGVTYIISLVAFKRAVVALHIRVGSKNHSALGVACPPPGVGAEISGKFRGQNQNYLHSQQHFSRVCGVIDLHNDTVLSSNGSALEAACGPPGMGANI